MELEKYITKSEEETLELGLKFAEMLKEGDLVAISGDLGTGKTEFVKGICQYFDVEEIVSSPTFTIMNKYIAGEEHGEIPIYHIDLYRIEKKEDLDEIGFQECIFSDTAIKIIEWAEKADGFLPNTGYKINIKSSEDNESERIFHIKKF